MGTIITGATGFVGGELLVKLLRDTNRKLVCPVRASSATDAAARGRDRLAELLDVDDAARYQSRVQWLRADIEERHLGWADSQWHEVASNTIEIYHCAASVSFDLPLEQAHRINVSGTAHVYELAQAAAARHGNFGRFHQVSTAYVAGLTKGRVSPNFLPADRAKNFRNTYERTKARAERYLRGHASNQVPVSIHRPSIIAGAARTGHTTNWNVLYVPMKMAARGVLPVFTRGGRELVDSVAVDFFVEAMVTFSQLDSGSVESHHHTAGPTAFRVTELIRATTERAGKHAVLRPSQTKLLGPGAWRLLTTCVSLAAKLPKRAGALRTKARLAKRSIDQCSVYLPYSRVDTIFDASKDHDVLRVFGVEMPTGPDYLATIIEYAISTNFGKVSPADQDAVAA